MGWFSKKVAVTFVDDATGQPFATAEMPPDDLPESFELETTLSLGQSNWVVVDAIPRTRLEYAKSRILTVRLRRIEMMNPHDILFSLPSICDRIPGIGTEGLSTVDFLLSEDEWRQVEFVSRQQSDEIQAEIDSIRRIHEQERVGSGFRNIHVRRGPEPPIAGNLTLEDIQRAFGGSIAPCRTGYRGGTSAIASSYSFTTADGLSCYGLSDQGNVSVFAIASQAMATAPDRSADSLAELAAAHALELVDWCRCARAGADDPMFRRLLGVAPR